MSGSQSVELALLDDPGAFRDEFLALDAAAAVAYDRFVYDSPEQADRVREALFARGAGESSPPAGKLLLANGTPAAMIAVLPAAPLRRRRLTAALTIARDASLALSAAVQARLRLAAGTLMRVADDDAYLARIAVQERVAGTGLGRAALAHALAAARGLVARRCVLDVADDNTRALALYARHGFEPVGRGDAADPESGRTLRYIHLAAPL